MEGLLKKGAYGILVTMAVGILVYLPPMFEVGKSILSVTKVINDANATLQTHEKKLQEHDAQISASLKNIREFRSVWCIDRLSSKGVQPAVLKACAEWIKEP